MSAARAPFPDGARLFLQDLPLTTRSLRTVFSVLALTATIHPAAQAENARRYRLEVHTCDAKDAESDADIYVSVWDGASVIFWDHFIDNEDVDDFQRNKTDTFEIPVQWSGGLTKIAFDHGSKRDQWCIDRGTLRRDDGKAWGLVIPEPTILHARQRIEFALQEAALD